MEDEHGDVGPVSGDSVSELPSSHVDLPTETLIEMGSENQAELSYEDEDEGEIMVEVIGCDVFVDGVSANKDGDLVSGEVGNSDNHVWDDIEDDKTQSFPEPTVVSSERDGNIVSGDLEVKFSESVGSAGGLDEAWNPGIEAKSVSSSAMVECMTGRAEEVIERASVVVNEESMVGQIDTVDNNIPAVVLSDPDEAFVVGDGGTGDKEILLHPGNGAASKDILGADSVKYCEETNAAGDGGHHTLPEVSIEPNGADPKSDRVDGLVGEETLTTGNSEDADFSANAESASPDGDFGGDAEVLVDEEFISAESKEMILEQDTVQTDVHDENEGRVKEFTGIEREETHGIDGDSQEQSFVIEKEQVMGMDVDQVLDFEDVPGESLITTGVIETDTVQQTHKSNDPTQLADDGDAPLLKEDKDLKIDTQAAVQENLTHTICLSSTGQTENLQTDSGRYTEQLVIATRVAEVTNDQNVAIPLVNVVVGDGNGDGDGEIGEGTDAESAKELLDGQVTAETMALDAACSKVENIAEECGSPQNKELEVSIQETETPNDGVYELESFSFMPNEVTGVEAFSDITQFSAPLEMSNCNDHHILEGHISETEVMDLDESDFDQTNHHEKEVEEPSSETDKLKLSNDEPVKSPSFLRMSQSGYLSPPESDGQFIVSDLVWGKVRSHPWWPGQIFDPADASERAVKHQKKESYLVAYFGDRTFAWNDSSLLKPFRSQFSHIEKQSNSEAFQNAVNTALEEVSRRVELGLACSCIPKEAFEEIESQIVENTGIREESSERYGVDQSSKASSFEPDKLLHYVRELAPRAAFGADRLDVVIARAQLSAFCRFKGYRLPAGFPSSGELLENDADTEQIIDEIVSSHMDLDSSKKERSLTDLMGDKEYSLNDEDVSVTSGNKRKTVDLLEDRSDRKVSVYAAKSTNQAPKPSFKIGDCIRRVASQLTGSTSMVKGDAEIDGSLKMPEYSGRQYIAVTAVSSSLNEKLSQLQHVAQDPNKRYSFLNKMVTFFSGFRSSVIVNKRSRKKKADKAINGSALDFEFDDVNDSYWTDRIVQNYSEKQLLHTSENGVGNLPEVPIDGEKTVKSARRPNSRKRYSSGNYPTASSEVDESVKRRKQESSPAELILIFAERNCVPSEINLNKMFRRFGPLMESETEVDHDSGRAKVIFKRGSDAQVAHSSAKKFNIFGPALVNYEIGYSPLISVKVSPLAIPQFQDDAALML